MMYMLCFLVSYGKLMKSQEDRKTRLPVIKNVMCHKGNAGHGR